jgi:OTU domain-containing protein 3
MSKDKEKAMDRAMKSSLKKKSIQYESSMMKFSVQIRALNLRIRDVDADGNCLFRAVADQIEGNQQNHLKYRHAVVDYMQDNPDLFKPFIDQDFDNVCF